MQVQGSAEHKARVHLNFKLQAVSKIKERWIYDKVYNGDK